MSLKYDFVTPLTSMVVTKPETEEGQSSPLIADKLTEGKGVQFNSQVTSDVREWERDALT